MKERVTGGALILTMLKKDFQVYSRNMIYLFLTILSLVLFIVIFWLVPDTVEEDFDLAIYPPLSVLIDQGRADLRSQGVPESVIKQLDDVEKGFAEEGLTLIEFAEEAELKGVISGELELYHTASGEFIAHDPAGERKKPADASRKNLQLGIALKPTFFSETMLGGKTEVIVYADAAVPDELRGAMEGFVREMAFALSGHEIPVQLPDEEVIILGQDRLGDQISMRSRMRPLIAFFMLMMETFALASLISNEVLQRTVTALLVTPLRVWHFLLSKTIFGAILAFSQAVIVLIFVRSFTVDNWPLLLLTVFLGAILFTAVAMLVGSAGKDFIGQLMFSMLFIIPLMIPAFAVLFPGSVAGWVRVLPSYPIVRLLYDITIHDALWADSALSYLNALAWVLVLYGAGLFVLKRKVATL